MASKPPIDGRFGQHAFDVIEYAVGLSQRPDPFGAHRPELVISVAQIRSGQFSLKVSPSTNIREPTTWIRFWVIRFMTCSAT
jgi:hypothetical protein